MNVFVAKNMHNEIVTMGTTAGITLHNLQQIIGFPLEHNLNDYRGREQIFTIEEYDVLDFKIMAYSVQEYVEGQPGLVLSFEDTRSMMDCIVGRYNAYSKADRSTCHWVVHDFKGKVIGVMGGDVEGLFRSTI